MIGTVAIPPDFKYMDAFLQGRPQHDRYDRFSIRHPKMDAGKRAKIFAPFDALRGFSFAITRKDVPYEEKPELCPEDLRELNRRLALLRELTRNSGLARQNRVRVTLTYFSPCADSQNEACGKRGQTRTVTGLCRGVDPEISRTIRIDDSVFPFENILWISEEQKD